MTDPKPRSLLKLSCMAGLVLVALAALIGGGAAGYAAWQIRGISPKHQELKLGDVRGGETLSLELEASVARVVLSPAAAGEALRCEANFDPEFYRLESDDSAGGLRLRFVPTGPDSLALLRMKLGAEPPLLRISLPVDQAVSINGRLRGSFAAMEFAGTSLRSLDLDLDGAAVTVSFSAALERPMDRLRLVGDKGSIEVTGLGHASPERAELRQRLGELDLDLRGTWVQDTSIEIDARFAGGALWLPSEGVVIVGLDESPVPAPEPEGDNRPRLDIDLSHRGGRMVLID